MGSKKEILDVKGSLEGGETSGDGESGVRYDQSGPREGKKLRLENLEACLRS